MISSRFSWACSSFVSSFSLVLLTKELSICCLFSTALEIFSSTSFIDLIAYCEETDIGKHLIQIIQLFNRSNNTSRRSLAAKSFFSISSSEGCGRVGVEMTGGDGARVVTGSARMT